MHRMDTARLRRETVSVGSAARIGDTFTRWCSRPVQSFPLVSPGVSRVVDEDMVDISQKRPNPATCRASTQVGRVDRTRRV